VHIGTGESSNGCVVWPRSKIIQTRLSIQLLTGKLETRIRLPVVDTPSFHLHSKRIIVIRRGDVAGGTKNLRAEIRPFKAGFFSTRSIWLRSIATRILSGSVNAYRLAMQHSSASQCYLRFSSASLVQARTSKGLLWKSLLAK